MALEIYDEGREPKKAKYMHKKVICVMFIITVLLISLIPKIEFADDSNQTSNKDLIGDVNGSGIIDISDVIAMLQHLSNEKTQKHSGWKLDADQFRRADINEDNIVDIRNDVISLLKYLAASKNSRIAQKHPEWLALINDKNNIIVPTDIALNKSQLDMMVGEKATLTATVVPEEAENKTYKWKSTNEKVVQVDSNGILIAVGEGQCSVNATTWNGVTKACAVVVKPYSAGNGNTTNNTTNSTSGGGGSGGTTSGGSGGWSSGGRWRWNRPVAAEALVPLILAMEMTLMKKE